MAITFDASSNSGAQTGTPYSWTHTPVGTPTIVFVGLGTDGGVVSSITYGGTTMTQATNTQVGPSTFLYYLANPPSGAQTVTVTLTAGGFKSFSWTLTYLGTVTATPLDGTGTSNAFTATPSVSVTTAVANSWIVNVIYTADTGFALTVAAPTVQRVNLEDLVNFQTLGAGDRSTTTAGAYSSGWTAGGNSQWSMSAAGFKVAAATTPVGFYGSQPDILLAPNEIVAYQ